MGAQSYNRLIYLSRRAPSPTGRQAARRAYTGGPGPIVIALTDGQAVLGQAIARIEFYGRTSFGSLREVCSRYLSFRS